MLKLKPIVDYLDRVPDKFLKFFISSIFPSFHIDQPLFDVIQSYF